MGKTGETATSNGARHLFSEVCVWEVLMLPAAVPCSPWKAGDFLLVNQARESSLSHSVVSCLQVLIKVLAGYAAERSCCIADRLCSVLLAEVKSM